MCQNICTLCRALTNLDCKDLTHKIYRQNCIPQCLPQQFQCCLESCNKPNFKGFVALCDDCELDHFEKIEAKLSKKRESLKSTGSNNNTPTENKDSTLTYESTFEKYQRLIKPLLVEKPLFKNTLIFSIDDLSEPIIKSPENLKIFQEALDVESKLANCSYKPVSFAVTWNTSKEITISKDMYKTWVSKIQKWVNQHWNVKNFDMLVMKNTEIMNVKHFGDIESFKNAIPLFNTTLKEILGGYNLDYSDDIKSIDLENGIYEYRISTTVDDRASKPSNPRIYA